MRLGPRIILGTLVVLSAAPVRADDPGLVAVLPLNAPKLDADLRGTLEEDIRTVTGDVLSPSGFIVLTGDNTLQVLSDNGIDASKACEANCALAAAKEMKARLFISGSATKVEGEYVAFIRLFESKTGRQLGSVKLEGEKVKDLRRQFEAEAPKLFKSIVTPAPAPAAAPAPVAQPVVQPAAPKAVPEATAPDSGGMPSRFKPTGGTVYDTKTRLTWQRNVTSQRYTWSDAKAYCTGLNVEGSSGWRLPTTDELESMIDTSQHPAVNAAAFPNTPSMWFWTSVMYANKDGYAWLVHVDGGQVRYDDFGFGTAVRCVR